MKPLINQITECIEKTFDIGGGDYSHRIIIYPCGDVGIQTIEIMKNVYGLEPAYIIDNHKCQFASAIHDSLFIDNLDTNEYVLMLCSTNHTIYENLKNQVLRWKDNDKLIELECMIDKYGEIDKYPDFKTEIGKYSYGPLCKNHILIKKIGAFCSFAEGTDVVMNHETHFLSTHPFISEGKEIENLEYDYIRARECVWYFEGVQPKGMKCQNKRIVIGNDVWLGRNVLITNSSNIGNGVIAGAGAIITKDVPDYAIVAGVPARIIKFRYTPKQVQALNLIAWWDWSDDDIRKRYDDFYLPIDDFIEKYI